MRSLVLLLLPAVAWPQALPAMAPQALPAALHPHLPALTLPHGLGSSTYIYTVHWSGSGASNYTFPLAPSLLRVNSLPVTLPATALPLRRGLNIVELTAPALQRAAAAPALLVQGALPPPAAGAPLPYTEVEAESAAVRTTGAPVGPSFSFGALAAEASGRRAVALAPGQHLELELPVPANALTLRFSIPDAAAGGGLDTPLQVLVDGALVRTVTLTSNYSWQYGNYPFTKNPADGGAHHFFDELDVMLPAAAPAGATLRLVNPPSPQAAGECGAGVPVPMRRDCGFDGINASQCLARQCCWLPVTPNPAHTPYCFHPAAPPPPPARPGNLTVTLDLLDLHLVPPPLPEPPGAVSAVAHGADPTGARDSSDALAAALAAAGAARAPLWLPPGTFALTRPLLLSDNATIIGAGAWHAVLRGAGLGLYGGGGARGGGAVSGVRVSGLALAGETRVRNDDAEDAGVFGALSASVLSALTISHTKCGMWLRGPFDGLLVAGVRIHDTTADGVNFCSGATRSAVTQSLIRNTGDDGLAMWSASAANAGNSFDHNTVQVPVLANGIALYGGADNSVTANAVGDTVTQGGGLHVGNRFGAVPLAGRTLVAGNVVTRGGCLDQNWGFGVGAVWLYALEAPLSGAVALIGNTLVDSPYEAYQFIGSHAISNVSLVNESVRGVGSFVFQVQAAGEARAQGVVASGVGKAGVYNCSAAFALLDGGGNAGFATQQCGF